MKLINLSNHPCNLWTQEQREAGESFGEIIDYPFPNVSPDSNEEEISLMAEKIVENIINKYSSVVIHLMGEFTLCYSLIKRFQQRNITCIASCTERNVKENANGEKIVKFEFKRFRKYE
ncbi:MAG: CRISPR-associated protein [Bacteroidales bacterium]|nr:CRISPR-associated protein [Bacteroidales bacterium]